MTSFKDLGLSEPILRALADAQYETPTPIQNDTIPHLMAGRDVIGIAQTGTGKTAAFALPILHQIGESRQRPERRTCRTLVLSPTRELSSQILDSFQTYGRYLKPSVALAIGGVPINRQVRALVSGAEILVATPGRLLDLMRMGAVRLDHIGFFVLDEADRMLDMGFIHDIKSIIAKLPHKRQSLFFSATMSREISDLAGQMLKDPVRVAVTPEATTVERIAQRVLHVERNAKPALLAKLLREEKIDRALVFTRTKRGADKVVRLLEKSGHAAEAIHGNKSQNQRERVLAAFRTGDLRTLVATDIAARGIDVDGVSHVFNYDLPNVPESYVHRIGRTARAGADGTAISFCDGEERAFLRDIERLIRITIPATDERGQHPVEAGGDKRPSRAADQRRQPPRHPARQEDRPHRAKSAPGRPQHGARATSAADGEAHHHKHHEPRQQPRSTGRPASGSAKQQPAAQPTGQIPQYGRPAAAPGRPPKSHAKSHSQPQGNHQGNRQDTRQETRQDNRAPKPHQGRPGQERPAHGQSRPERNGSNAPAHDRGGIANVAFMRQKPAQQRRTGGERRAPR